MPKSQTLFPVKKVSMTGVGGLVAVVLVWASNKYGIFAITPVGAAAIGAICAGLAAYLTPPGDDEVVR